MYNLKLSWARTNVRSEGSSKGEILKDFVSDHSEVFPYRVTKEYDEVRYICNARGCPGGYIVNPEDLHTI